MQISRVRRIRLLWLALALVLPALFLAVVRISALDGFESDQDSLFHAQMADSGPAVCMSKSFPQMTLSVWHDSFSDKELGYHLALCFVRSLQAVAGVDLNSPPFNFPALLFASLAVLCFVFACSRFCRTPWIWAFSLLLVTLSPVFSQRLLALRPHVLSIALMLLFFALMLRTQGWKSLAIGVIAGFSMAWCYSNPHFILVPACAVALAKAMKGEGGGRLLNFLLPVSAFCGILLGYLLHPQFPNNFIIWKTQCVDVVSQALMPVKGVVLADEFESAKISNLLANLGVLALFAASLGIFIFQCWKRRLNSALTSSLLVAAVFTLLFLRQPRALEYSCPFTVLSAAIAFSSLRRNFSLGIKGKVCVCALLAGLALFTGCKVHDSLKAGRHFRPFSDFASFLSAKGFPAGSLIANVNWSDFPPLFFAAPNYRYLCGMDPMFGYRFSPERMTALEAFRTGKTMLLPSKLAELTGSDFAFVSIFGWQLAENMSRHGYAIVYQGKDGWLFDLRKR